MRKSLLAVPILLSAALVSSCSSSGTASDAVSSAASVLKSAAASAVAGASNMRTTRHSLKSKQNLNLLLKR